MPGNAIVTFLRNEIVFLEQIYQELKKTQKEALEYVFGKGIKGMEYLISAAKKESFCWYRSAGKFFDSIIAISYVEQLLSDDRIKPTKILYTPKGKQNFPKESALTIFLNDLRLIATQSLEGFDYKDNPKYACVLKDSIEGIDVITEEAEQTEYCLMKRGRIVQSFVCLSQLCEEVRHYALMQKVEDACDKIFSNTGY